MSADKEVSLADVEAARSQYVNALKTVRQMHTQEHRLDFARRHLPFNEYIEGLVRDADLRQRELDEVKDRYEAQERKRQRDTDEAVVRSNNELAIEQLKLARRATDLADKQAVFAQEQLGIAAKQLELADRQIAVAKSATKAAWGSVAAAIIAALVAAAQLLEAIREHASR